MRFGWEARIGSAMAGVSRQMARSFVSSAKAAGRFCGNKTVGGSGSGAARGGLGLGGGAAAAPRSAPSSSFSSPKSFFMESRRPGHFFARYAAFKCSFIFFLVMIYVWKKFLLYRLYSYLVMMVLRVMIMSRVSVVAIGDCFLSGLMIGCRGKWP